VTLGILLFVLGIFVMILAHEAGHFVAARRFGIKVEEFFVGFGPRLWSFRRGETEYGVKALPLGGYVRIAGMNPFQEPSPEDLPRTFGAKPKWQRAVVLVAGAATHFVLAFVFLVVLFGVVGIPTRFAPQVEGVEPRLDGEPSPAAAAGLRPGDEVLSVDGRQVDYEGFLRYVGGSAGERITIVVERDGRRVTLEATPVLAPVEGREIGRLGILVGAGEVLARSRSGPLETLVDSGRTVGRLVVDSFRAMGRVFGPEGLSRIGQALGGTRERTVEDPIGVVGAGRFAGQAVAAGQLDVFLTLFAFFNVFVGILNLLPLPPLDGGHLAVLGIEAATRRRIDPRRLIPITALVAGFLILFTVSLLYLDVVAPIPNLFQ
jgi:membrane-associated protease RseP (regulator of RpoE activity)